MVSRQNAKKRRPKAPVDIRRKSLPWWTIGAVATVLALAAGVFAVVLNTTNEKAASDQATGAWTPSVNNPDPPSAIPGIYVGAATPAVGEEAATYVDYQAATHVTSDQRVAYNRFPPVGGPHDGTWANCNGVVYDVGVRDENMVHTLEHGAVWITYDPDLITQDDLNTLTSVVDGQPYLTLSPRPGLDSPISLQAWAHQLKLESAADERVQQFITALRQNRWVHPENGATCQQPSFDTADPPPFVATPPGPDAVTMSGTSSTTPAAAPATTGQGGTATTAPTAGTGQ